MTSAMATIVRKHLADVSGWPEASVAERWRQVARAALAWLQVSAIPVRDAVVLVPYVQLLVPARRAFAAAGGWQPRIETSRTFAASLGPPGTVAAPPAPTLDLASDSLTAQRMLGRQPWGARWQRRDPRGFERAALDLARTAQELARAAGQVAPDSRAAWWATARAAVANGSGPGGRERSLAQAAVEWAALAAAPDTDRLFRFAASAWIAVEAGSRDALVGNVLAAAGSPALVIDANPAADVAFAKLTALPSFAICDSFEDEAQAAAAQVLEHLRCDQRPVALIAQDRVLVRRIRALLERSQAVLLDETGWKLSTTRAAAQLMTMLRAARHDAGADAFFEWLKSGTRWPARSAAGVAALEAASRRQAAWRVDAIAAMALENRAAERVREEALAVLAPLRAASTLTLTLTLTQWLQASRDALEQSGAMAVLGADAAGQQVLAALGADPANGALPIGVEALGDATLSLAAFTQWVDTVLEQANFIPGRSDTEGDAGAAHDADGPVDVVVTPLARAIMRPFAAAVLPGADHSHLGAFPTMGSPLPSKLRSALGLPTAQDRASAELLAFAHLLALPELTLMRRREGAGEALGDSALVQRLSLAAAEQNRALRRWHDPRSSVAVAAAPLARASVAAASLVPTRLSATSYEALRACPYRFFARSMLRLGEDAELDGDLEKRDYGLWLHRVLHVFHRGRDGDRTDSAGDAAVDAAELHAAGRAVFEQQGLDAAEFLPWSATFEAFVPVYVAWLHEREALGSRWAGGEVEMKCHPHSLSGLELHGIVDRIDGLADGGLALFDYKTGDAGKLKKLVQQRFEDTQLAFYAALVGEGDARPVSAAYLALESRSGLQEIEHEDVATSALALVEGMAVDMIRLRGGASLVALGEGSTCDHCAARGLCRRDHWSAETTGDAAVADPP